jgi:hypothetical protein
MKRVVFLTSHLCSGVFELKQLLNKHRRIDLRGTGLTYTHPTDVDDLIGLGHKLRNSAAIYGDHLVYNTDLQHKRFYSFGHFIYLVRSPRETLNEIITHPNSNYTEDSAFRYYVYRLRRMCEMAKRTPKGVVLTYQNILDGKGLNLIEDLLEINSIKHDPLVYQDKVIEDNFSPDLMEKAEESYERHLYYLKQLQHISNVTH